MESDKGESSKGDKVENAWSLPVLPFSREDNPDGLLCESAFATLFPKYREKYIRECWPLVETALSEHNVKAELDVILGEMKVMTTRKTWDPAIILKAFDVVRLIARGVRYDEAVRVLEDNIGCDIIKVGTLVRKKGRFVKRRKRIIGPNGATLKAIELLTNCYVLVQGHTVASVGPYKGLQQVRKIVEDTMKNVHPIYNIKALMIKRELAKDPKLKNEDWERFLPKFASQSISKRKQPKKVKKKKDYTPFPPEQLERKVDREMASGEYFLKDYQKRDKKMAEKKEKKSEAENKRLQRRNAAFIPPTKIMPSKEPNSNATVDIAKLKNKVRSLKDKGFRREAPEKPVVQEKKKRRIH